MLQPDQLRAIIKAQPDIIQHLTSAAKIHAIGEDAYYKAIERDPKEPGRKRKMAYERKFANLMKRIFDRQKESIAPQLMATFYASKGSDDYALEWTEDEKTEAVSLMMEIYGDGIDLFGQSIYDGLPDEFVNVEAAELAKKYAYDEIKVLGKQLNDTTQSAIQNAISSFTQPGFTIADVMAKLPFDADRALRIAVTEITRTYSSANQASGEAWQKQFPDLTIVKTWYTNQDDRVCDICGPRHMTSVIIADKWADIDNPPAHPNCRCWTDYGSTLGGSVEMYQAPVVETDNIMDENSLSNIFDIFKSVNLTSIRKIGFTDIFNSINKIHNIPNSLINSITVNETNNRGYSGIYSQANKSISLSKITKKESMEYTISHEFGHLIDNNILKMNNQLRQNLINSINENSQELRMEWLKLQNISVQTPYAGKQPMMSSQFREYLSSDNEMIARSYSQYIAIKTQNENMINSINSHSSFDKVNNNSYYQWPEQSFKPIFEVWENIFKELGLLK